MPSVRKNIIILLAVLLVSALNCGATAIDGLVISVADGDTIKIVDTERNTHIIRLNGIDAPESEQPYGDKARALLNSLVYRKNVHVEYTEEDQYGRLLGMVRRGRKNINLEMIKAGLAWHYAFFTPELKNFASAETKAKSAKLGLWAAENPQAPWDYRKIKKQEMEKQNSGEISK